MLCVTFYMRQCRNCEIMIFTWRCSGEPCEGENYDKRISSAHRDMNKKIVKNLCMSTPQNQEKGETNPRTKTWVIT